LRSHRAEGESNDGGFDGLSLKAVAPADAPADKPLEQAAKGLAKKPTHSFVLNGTWRVEGKELVQTDRDVWATLLLGTGALTEFNMKFKIKFIDAAQGPWLNSVFDYTPPLYQGPQGDQ
jgi:hypothetical protein